MPVRRAPLGFALAPALAITLALPGCRTSSEGAKSDPPPPCETPPHAAAPPARPEEMTLQPRRPRDWSPPKFTARQAERQAMVEVIRRYGLTDEAVLGVMAAVPRHEFVPADLAPSAYADTPLPIGHGQTISQPYIVAEMTHQLRLTPGAKVLEIGTGSGYQAAVLAHLAPKVFSIEIVRPLAQEAAKRLARLGYGVVRVRYGDGFYGWPEEAPFDAIIGTCVAGEVPPPLIQQLKPGGRMVIPLGERDGAQDLALIEKDAEGKVTRRSLLPVRFVPLLREDPTAK